MWFSMCQKTLCEPSLKALMILLFYLNKKMSFLSVNENRLVYVQRLQTPQLVLLSQPSVAAAAQIFVLVSSAGFSLRSRHPTDDL